MAKSQWQVWRNRRGRVKGIAIVHQCSDYGLELHSSLAESERLPYCERLCKLLNAEQPALETGSEWQSCGHCFTPDECKATGGCARKQPREMRDGT